MIPALVSAAIIKSLAPNQTLNLKPTPTTQTSNPHQPPKPQPTKPKTPTNQPKTPNPTNPKPNQNQHQTTNLLVRRITPPKTQP